MLDLLRCPRAEAESPDEPTGQRVVGVQVVDAVAADHRPPLLELVVARVLEVDEVDRVAGLLRVRRLVMPGDAIDVAAAVVEVADLLAQPGDEGEVVVHPVRERHVLHAPEPVVRVAHRERDRRRCGGRRIGQRRHGAVHVAHAIVEALLGASVRCDPRDPARPVSSAIARQIRRPVLVAHVGRRRIVDGPQAVEVIGVADELVLGLQHRSLLRAQVPAQVVPVRRQARVRAVQRDHLPGRVVRRRGDVFLGVGDRQELIERIVGVPGGQRRQRRRRPHLVELAHCDAIASGVCVRDPPAHVCAEDMVRIPDLGKEPGTPVSQVVGADVVHDVVAGVRLDPEPGSVRHRRVRGPSNRIVGKRRRVDHRSHDELPRRILTGVEGRLSLGAQASA